MAKKLSLYGREFTIEWYYDERGQSGARDYFDNLVIERRKKAFYLFRTMGDLGEILNIEKFKNGRSDFTRLMLALIDSFVSLLKGQRL